VIGSTQASLIAQKLESSWSGQLQQRAWRTTLCEQAAQASDADPRHHARCTRLLTQTLHIAPHSRRGPRWSWPSSAKPQQVRRNNALARHWHGAMVAAVPSAIAADGTALADAARGHAPQQADSAHSGLAANTATSCTHSLDVLDVHRGTWRTPAAPATASAREWYVRHHLEREPSLVAAAQNGLPAKSWSTSSFTRSVQNALEHCRQATARATGARPAASRPSSISGNAPAARPGTAIPHGAWKSYDTPTKDQLSSRENRPACWWSATPCSTATGTAR
jgi:hypothetical protein